MPWYQHGRPFEDWTVVVAAQGPSLIPEQVDEASHIFPTCVCKDVYMYAENAKLIYACDRAWWHQRWRTDEALRKHKAVKVTLDYQKLDTKVPDLQWLKCGGNHGFIFEEGVVAHGRNTGHQLINLVVNMGAPRLILMGYDMRVLDGKTHCHDRHVPVPHTVFDDFYGAMMQAAPLLVKKGIKVINTSMRSRLTCFPKMPFNEALDWGRG